MNRIWSSENTRDNNPQNSHRNSPTAKANEITQDKWVNVELNSKSHK